MQIFEGIFLPILKRFCSGGKIIFLPYNENFLTILNRQKMRRKIYTASLKQKWKIFTIILFALALLSSCGKEEKRLEIFSPDAYAFPMEQSWELDGSFRVKGLEAKETKDEYVYSVTYSLTLLNAGNEKRIVIKDAAYEEQADEELADIGIDFQAELDSTFTEGKYKALINIQDNFSRKNAQLEFDIELSNN